MSDKPLAILYYVHDPMCSWCWGFRTQLLQLKQLLPDDIQFVSWVGGLAADSDEAMPEALQQDIQSAWKRIQQVIPSVQFNYDFWTLNKPRRSTYPACRAVIAARQLEDKAEQMTYAIQQAYYLNALNPSDLDTLTEAAISIGLNPAEFEALMYSEDMQIALNTELEQVREIGVYSFPSLVLQLDNEYYNVQLDYNSAQNSLADINRLRANHSLSNHSS